MQPLARRRAVALTAGVLVLCMILFQFTLPGRSFFAGRASLAVIYSARFLEGTGFAQEALDFTLAIGATGAARHIAVEVTGPDRPALRAQMNPAELREIELMRKRLPLLQQQKSHVYVMHGSPGGFHCPQGCYCIGRTAFETDSVPDAWIKPLMRMDEIWVPSEYVLLAMPASRGCSSSRSAAGTYDDRPESVLSHAAAPPRLLMLCD